MEVYSLREHDYFLKIIFLKSREKSSFLEMYINSFASRNMFLIISELFILENN